MKVVRTVAAMSRLAAKWPAARGRVVLVPTMGALHEGHLSLIDRARKAAGADGTVVVSIFVNPIQFGPKEDLSRYPRPIRRDLALCRERGTDIVFHPDAADMHARDRSIHIEETLLARGLCGRSRPGHFDGVCTVVAKLLNIVRPDAAVFGQKDFQQLAIIRRMVRELNFPVTIFPAETVREPDGLAMSSRNVYLTPAQRAEAPTLRRALLLAGKKVRAGERNPAAVRAVVERELATASLGRVDYVEVVDAGDLQPMTEITKSTLVALAVFFGTTRLIDNVVVTP